MSLPHPPSTHPASTTGLIPTESLADSIQRERSMLSGSPYRGSPVPVGYGGSPPPVVIHESPRLGSPSYQTTSVIATGTGPTYEQEVASFLDQTSPQRIREQSQSRLPPSEYMERAHHESVTGANSPARVRAGSPGGYVSGGSPGGYVGTTYVPIVSGSPPPMVHSSPVLSSSPVLVHTSPHVHAAGSPVPVGPIVPGEGESPRRIRAFGAPHSNPYDAGNQAVSQERARSGY